MLALVECAGVMPCSRGVCWSKIVSLTKSNCVVIEFVGVTALCYPRGFVPFYLLEEHRQLLRLVFVSFYEKRPSASVSCVTERDTGHCGKSGLIG